MKSTTKATVNKARKLRQTMTPPEIMLWQRFRAKPSGLKFRRQHPLGPYILDFYCASKKIAVEVDGAVHDMGNNPAHDAKRDAYLASKGIDVLRIAAQDVLRDPDSAADNIVRQILT
jgi:very-short-patch-repair endonuclease